jgi:hypothetical protein
MKNLDDVKRLMVQEVRGAEMRSPTSGTGRDRLASGDL